MTSMRMYMLLQSLVLVSKIAKFLSQATVHTNTICMHFGFDPLSRTFSNPCFFDENAWCISVDGEA